MSLTLSSDWYKPPALCSRLTELLIGPYPVLQMVAEAAARPQAPSQEGLQSQEGQASQQELEGLTESLRQADDRTKELEAQLDHLKKVSLLCVHPPGSGQSWGGAAH